MIDKSMQLRVVTVPGWKNSGKKHWMTRWEEKYVNWQRVNQANWDLPNCNDWVSTLDAVIAHRRQPTLLVAHSLGCVTIAHWASRMPRQLQHIVHALLVAPADVDQPLCHPALRDFAPLPMVRLPFKTTLIASTNDPFCSFDRARTLATCWHSHFVNAGALGHINVDSGHGPWQFGEDYISHLVNDTIPCNRPIVPS